MSCEKCDWMGWFRVDLPVSHPMFGKAVPCECTLRQATGEPPPGDDWTLESFPGDIKALNWAWKAYHRGHGVWVFWSRSFGTGKTGLLVALVNECRKHGRAALYESVPAMLDRLRSGFENKSYQDFMDALINIPVLALDEFHRYYRRQGNFVDGSPDWASEKLFQIVDARYMNYKQQLTLIATNRKPEPGDADPLSSRFCDSLRSSVVNVEGGDMRPVATELMSTHG